jgi:transcriptional regulator NrdR family protein
MNCPDCNSPTKVIDTAKLRNAVFRTRRCKNPHCARFITTEERIEPSIHKHARAALFGGTARIFHPKEN